MKLCALLCLCAVPLLLGIFLGETKRKRFRIRVALRLLLEEIRFQIREFSKPQDEILSSYQSPILEECALLPEIRRELAKTPCGALHRALLTFREKDALSPEEWEELLSFAALFGMQAMEPQLAHCDRILHLLEKREKEKASRLEGEVRIIRVLGLVLGLGIFILLI